MKRLLFILLFSTIVTLLSSSIFSYTGEVLGEIHLKNSCPTGLTFDGNNFWLADRKTDLIYKLDRTFANILKTFSAPGFMPSGLAFDGKYLWVSDLEEKKLYKINPKSEEIVKEIDSPSDSPIALAYDGRHLWVADNRDDKLHKIDREDGTTIESFPSPDKNPTGLTFDGKYLWCSDRVKDEIYMISPNNGCVINHFKAPGPFSYGLAYDGSYLYNVDYQDDKIYRIVRNDNDKFNRTEERHANITFTTYIHNYGPDVLKTFDHYVPVAEDRDSQDVISKLIICSVDYKEITDSWKEKILHFRFQNLLPGTNRKAVINYNAKVYAINYSVFPDEIGSLKEISNDIRDMYLSDGNKYDIKNEYITNLVKEIIEDEKNPYWIARKLYNYLIENLSYELVGGWNTAPTVLKRKTGSCSEYTFSYIALCRAAGIPARYVGSVVVRGDEASYDEVFHRWAEIYLPCYGWIPVDPNAGDDMLPSEQGRSFGGITNRFLITTVSGGNSDVLSWGYNYNNNYKYTGRCKVRIENIAEWEPVANKENAVDHKDKNCSEGCN